MTVFDGLIWGGAALTLAGVAALIWCVLTVARARRAGLDDDALRQRMRPVIAVNMGALALSMIGLLLVITGIMLG
ncbi:hypothetical protein GCM10011402_07680 [Paracoccus acridae]|uniref:Uncharacterized protein n=1 Tax=Paracoccus acridae TaxID=1795310 RepID=A0ABQ1VG22_9RHOB|nr:hypothetical protein [Paracoccus acridae]GGF58126.1 hypothetical protein GCM10011402_07680 [Paracoccus acridae]